MKLDMDQGKKVCKSNNKIIKDRKASSCLSRSSECIGKERARFHTE